MRAILVALLTLVALLSASAADKPNILLILADDLGYGDVRCYNDQSKVATPHLDRLAREGIRFTDAHSPATVCTPTRYSLMTGQMAFRVPNGGRVFDGIGGPSLIAPGRLTLPAMLRANGYATACVGKWHVGTHPPLPAHPSLHRRAHALHPPRPVEIPGPPRLWRKPLRPRPRPPALPHPRYRPQRRRPALQPRNRPRRNEEPLLRTP